MIRSPLAAAMIAAGLAISPAPAQDGRPAVRWPQFRGPNGAGLAPDGMTFPERFGPAEKVVWKTALPAGHSSPCIWGDCIFLTGFDPAAKKLETLALDRRTGEVLWRRPAPTTTFEKVHEISNPATATPATDGERVYVYFGSFGLLCYDFAGAEQWKAALPIPTTRFGSGTSPVLAGDLVLLHAEYAPKAFLLAVDRRTGTTAWKKEFSTAVMEGYATPAVWRHDGLDEVVLHRPGRIAGHDPADGAERWWVDVTSNACCTPVVGDNRLFAVTWMMGGEPADRVKIPTFDELLAKYDKNKDGLISKDEFPDDLSFMKRVDAGDVPGADVKIKQFFDQLDANKDGQISRFEWAMVQMFANRPVEHGLLAIKPGGHGDVTKSHVLWREKKATPEVPSPLYYQGRVYTVRDGGIVSCLDAATGKVLFRERLGPGGAYFASPVAGDGKVYIASRNGVVVVLAAGDTFKVLARNDLQESILATPALTDGKVYLRTEKHLYAFGE
jgi:outer membrane protein assembly factor BamB